ncbi:MAG: C2H2-type zinc finger protein [Nitrospirota bacterium]|nr:C2H2-type zinc finger protein [Nitrospirota bacterium]
MLAHIPFSAAASMPAIFPVMIVVGLLVLFVAVALSLAEAGDLTCPVCQKKFRNPIKFRKHLEKGDDLTPKSV